MQLEIGIILTGLAVVLAAYFVIDMLFGRFSTWRDEVEASFNRHFEILRIGTMSPRSAATTYCAALIIAPLLSLLVLRSVSSALACFTLIYFTPRVFVNYMMKKRIQKFEEQLPTLLDQLARTVGAGLSLAQALEEISMNAASPGREEFGRISADHKLGSSLSEAIANAGKRLESQHFDLVAAALQVNIDKGGDLREALVSISQSMKDIWRLEQKLITASTEGRKAMLVISIVPIFVLLLVVFLEPSIASTLTDTLPGNAILVAAGLLYLIALGWLRRILSTEV